jgi:ABC-2 type transport system ATP-binding protein
MTPLARASCVFFKNRVVPTNNPHAVALRTLPRRLSIVADDVLTIRKAHKRFGNTQALDGASFALRHGECLALLGPNGAGKTTLVRAISGRVRLDEGEIRLLGEPLGNGPSGPALGLVPQETALYPLLTARENLEVFAALAGLPASEQKDRVRWALDWTGLAERPDEPIRQFSGGMKRRLNLACGVLHRPKVVLLDEPTVGVDPQSRQRIWEMLGTLRAEGASLLWTTHQLEEAQQSCDRIVILDYGRVIAEGTLAELVAQTVGGGRHVTMFLEAEPPEVLKQRGFTLEGSNAVRHRLDDVAVELPELLAVLGQAGTRVVDLRIEAPSLQEVFLHLTGRELRE